MKATDAEIYRFLQLIAHGRPTVNVRLRVKLAAFTRNYAGLVTYYSPPIWFFNEWELEPKGVNFLMEERP